MNSYFSPILKYLKTTDEADALINEIDHILRDLYTLTNISINQLIDQNLPVNIGSEIKKTFLDHGQSFEHHEEVKSFFLSLREEIAKTKVMTLSLAYHPTESHLQQLKNWCIVNINDPIIFEIRYESELIGGAIIILNGYYLDYSLKKKLNDFFTKDKTVTTSQ
jgi:hypothetical protein